MAKSVPSINSTELAKKIISEIDNADYHVDTLTKWMAHECAELLVKIENETDINLKNGYINECKKIITLIWENGRNHHHYLEPFHNVKETIRVLNALTTSPSSLFKYIHWDRKPDGKLEELVAITQNSAEEIVDICVLLATLNGKLGALHEWKDIGTLTEDEGKLLEMLEMYISTHRFEEKDATTLKMMSPKERNNKIYSKIKVLIARQQEILNTLIEENNRDGK